MSRQSHRRPWRVSWFDARWDETITRAYIDEQACRDLAQRMADHGHREVRVWRLDNGGYVDGRIERIEPS